jgi:hypothetical protein
MVFAFCIILAIKNSVKISILMKKNIKTSESKNKRNIIDRNPQSHLFLSARNELHYYEIGSKKSRKHLSLKSNITCFAPNQAESQLLHRFLRIFFISLRSRITLVLVNGWQYGRKVTLGL